LDVHQRRTRVANFSYLPPQGKSHLPALSLAKSFKELITTLQPYRTALPHPVSSIRSYLSSLNSLLNLVSSSKPVHDTSPSSLPVSTISQFSSSVSESLSWWGTTSRVHQLEQCISFRMLRIVYWRKRKEICRSFASSFGGDFDSIKRQLCNTTPNPRLRSSVYTMMVLKRVLWSSVSSIGFPYQD